MSNEEKKIEIEEQPLDEDVKVTDDLKVEEPPQKDVEETLSTESSESIKVDEEKLESTEKELDDEVDKALSKFNKKSKKVKKTDDDTIDELEQEYPINWDKIDIGTDGLPVINEEDKKVLMVLNLFQNRGDLEQYINTAKMIYKSILETTDENDQPIEPNEYDLKSIENVKKKLAYLQSISRDEAAKIGSYNNIYTMTNIIVIDKLILYIMKNNKGMTYGEAKEKLSKEGFSALIEIFITPEKIKKSLSEWKDIDKYVHRHLKVYNSIKSCFKQYGDNRKTSHLRTLNMMIVLEKTLMDFEKFVITSHTVHDSRTSSDIINKTEDPTILESNQVRNRDYDFDGFYKNNYETFRGLFEEIYSEVNRFNEIMSAYKTNPNFIKFTEDMEKYTNNKKETYYKKTEEITSPSKFLGKVESEIRKFIQDDENPEKRRAEHIEILKGKTEKDESEKRYLELVTSTKSLSKTETNFIAYYERRLSNDFVSNADLDKFIGLSIYEIFDLFEDLNQNRIDGILKFSMRFSNLIISKLIVEGFDEILDLAEKTAINPKNKQRRDDDLYELNFVNASKNSLQVNRMVKGYILNFVNNSISIMMSDTRAPLDENVQRLLKDSYIPKSINVKMLLDHDRLLMRKNMSNFLKNMYHETNKYLKSILETDSKVEWPWKVNILENKSKNQLKKLNKGKKRK